MYTYRDIRKNGMGMMILKANVGTIDRLIRVVLGLVLLSLFFVLDGGIKYVSLIGIVLLLTATIKFCHYTH